MKQSRHLRLWIICVQFVAALSMIAIARTNASASGGDGSTLIVALDRDAYRLRELYLLEDTMSDAVASRSGRISVGLENGSVDVIIRDMDSDGEFADVISNMATKKQLSIETTPAKSFSIDYSPNVVKTFGPERLEHDAGYLESYVDNLRPALPGVTITPEPHGAVVKSSDPSLGSAIKKKCGAAFIVTPLTATSWRVSPDVSLWPNEWTPAKRLDLEAKTAQALRDVLGDPLELSVYADGEGVRFVVLDAARHVPFMEAVKEAFEGNSNFVFYEASALDIRLSSGDPKLIAAPDQSNGPPVILPYSHPSDPTSSADLISAIEGLINPPGEIRIEGEGVVVRAEDAARNGELSSIVRKALARRTDLILKSLPDGSLQVELVPGAHLGAEAPTLSADQLLEAVKARLDTAKTKSLSVASLGSGRVRVDFGSSDDAVAFKASLSKPSGLTIRLVDETLPGASATAPSEGDEQFRLPTG